jgi:hypothetical protein
VGDHARIRGFLAAVRNRLRLQQLVGDGVVALAVVAGAMLVLIALAATAHPSTAWRSAWWSFVLGALVALAWAAGRPFLSLRLRADEPVARIVGERTGAGDLYVSAVELARALPSLEAEPALGSAELARAHLAAAVSRLDGTEPGALVELRPDWRRLAPGGVVVAAYLVAALAAHSQVARGWAILHQRVVESLPVSAEPIVADLEIRYTYPKYTGLPVRSVPGSSGDVLAPPGTQVALRARSLLPSRAASLELEDGAGKTLESRAIALEGDRLAIAFTVDKAGGYRFALQPTKGGAVREAEAHHIEVEADRPPRVDLAAPADDLELAGPRRVQLAWSVDDDYGIGDVELVWRSGPETGTPGGSAGKPPDHSEPPAPGSGRKTVRAAVGSRGASGLYEWDLAELDLEPGVRVSYHLEARDNDDISGPNIGVSRSYTLRIYSPGEKHEELLAEEQRLLDHSVALLADRLELPSRPDAASTGSTATVSPVERVVGAWSQLHAHSEGFLGELGRMQSDLGKDPLAPKDLRPALAAIHDRLGRLVRDEGVPLRDLKRKSVSPERGERLLRDGNGRQVAELERDVLLLDDLIRRQRLEQLLSVTDQMQEVRDRLKNLLAEFKKTRSDQVRREIERELRRLEQKLAELQSKASKLVGEVPDEFINREALGDNDMGKRLDSIRELLAKGDVDKAMEEMKRLSSALDKMAQAMEGDLKGFRDERFSAEERAMSELEDRLADLEHDQRQIQHDTGEVQQRYRDEAKRVLRDRVEPFIKRAKEKVAEMKKKLGAVDPDAVGPLDQQEFDSARKRVDELGGALDQADLDQAREAAHGAAEQLGNLARRLRRHEDRQWEANRARMHEARERVEESEPIARKLADELAEVFPKPDELLPPAERRKLDGLGTAEEALRRRTDEARKDLERRLSRSPSGQPGEAGEGLGQAAEHMGRASQALRQGNPRSSLGEEGQAADELQRLRQQVQRERRPRSEGAGGGVASKETVKIPGADEYRAPHEFRQDLLDAMKREAPRQYQDQVRRYYEELVK